MLTRKKSQRQPRASFQSGTLTSALAEHEASTSWLEDVFWEQAIAGQLRQLLRSGNERALTTISSELGERRGQEYDLFMDITERETETRIEPDNHILLLAIPVLCWSRFAIPSGKIPDQIMRELRVHIQAHLLAKETTLSICNLLFGPDQLPQGYCDTYALADRLATNAKLAADTEINPDDFPESERFVADTRYVLAAIAAKPAAPIFRWQEEPTSSAEAKTAWRSQIQEVLRRLLPACALEILPAGGFHAALRQSDRDLRPFSLRAGVEYLQSSVGIQPADLHAVAAAYRDGEFQEVRVAFGPNGHDVYHGVVWPLLDAEETTTETLTEIGHALAELGLGKIVRLDMELPSEFCDDCGAPLFPDKNGEPVHAENPAEQEAAGSYGQLH